MKISLSREVERLIQEKVGTGRYRSADEVVREGLELLQQRDAGAEPRSSNHANDLAEAFQSIAKDVADTDWGKIPADLSKLL